jgi:integral membrane protein (TIGR01906 family)
VILVLIAVRLILSPLFIELEYRTPNFPADPYGFTFDDRITYSNIALEYLLNDSDISFLGDLQFPEGEQAPPISCQFMDDCTFLYNQRELKHMEDVKNVVRVALKVLYVSIVVLILFGVWAYWGDWVSSFRKGVSRGGWLTVILIGMVIGFVLIAFGVIFVLFHQIFFESGTWTFYFSDTLIRLFPERFWRDTFLFVGAITAGLGIALGYGLKER